MQLGCATCANCLARKVCADAFQRRSADNGCCVAGHRPPPDPYPNPKALPRLPNPAQRQQQGKESGAARRLNRRRRRSHKPHAHARLRVVEAHEGGEGAAHPAVRAVRVLSLPPAVAIGFGASPRQQKPRSR